jgi:hypothetical protein
MIEKILAGFVLLLFWIFIVAPALASADSYKESVLIGCALTGMLVLTGIIIGATLWALGVLL